VTHVRARLLTGALLAAALVLGVALPSAASALETHQLISVFTGTETPAGSLSSPNGIGIDESTGDLYIADVGNHVVDKFDASGHSLPFSALAGSALDGSATPAGSFAFPRVKPEQSQADGATEAAVAVDNDPLSPSYRDLYVLDAGHGVIDKFAPTGAYLGQLTGTPGGPFATTGGVYGAGFGPYGLAVGPGGKVWVYLADGDVAQFDASGTYLSSYATGCVPFPGLAVDSDENAYVLCNSFAIRKFSPTGTDLGSRGEIGLSFAPTIDPTNDHLFLATGGRAEEYDPAGVLISEAISPSAVSVFVGALAVNGTTGDLYRSIGNPLEGPEVVEVDHFGPLVTVPDAHTGQAESITPHGARLTGKINPSGTASSYQFEYGTTTGYGTKAPASPAPVGEDSSEHPESAEVSGLEPNTTYHFRIDGINECQPGKQCTNPGKDQTFRTTGPPAVGLESVGAVGQVCAALHAEVNPDGLETTVTFEYGPTRSYGSQVPPVVLAASVGFEDAGHEVCGLTAGATYHFRAAAANSAGPASGIDQQFTTIASAPIEAVSATEVTATGATLQAQIKPLGNDTHYRFEYGTDTGYGTSVPAPAADIGSGSAAVAVSQAISGLAPNTTYHYRVVAENALGTTASPDHTFIFLTALPPEGCPNQAERVGLSASLPDCRAYEMVTPPDKNGSTVSASAVFNLQEVGIAADGSRLTVPIIQCFAGAGSCTANRVIQGSSFSFERMPAGWVTTPLAPTASQFPGISRFGALAESGAALFAALRVEGGTEDFYVRKADGSLLDLGPVSELPGHLSGTNQVHSLTPDLSHFLYESINGHLWAFDPTVGNAKSLFEYVGTGNIRPLLVGVSGGPGSTELISRCGTEPANVASRNEMSSDGATIFFQAHRCPTGTGSNEGVEVPAAELYARLYGELPGAETVHVSASRCGSGGGASEIACRTAPPGDASFQGAAADGSVAYFTSTRQLTDEASEDPESGDNASTGCFQTAGPNGCNLYLYRLRGEDGEPVPLAERLSAISVGDSSGLGPQVQGTVAISPDGSHAYFVARGVLTGADAEGHEPRPGGENLYLYERDAAHPSGRTTFIATLVKATPGEPGDTGQWTNGPLLANVTPDGRFLVFTSHVGLTADATRAEGPAQVYRYDATDEHLTRISIGRRGFDDNGNAGAGNARIAEPQGQATAEQSRSDITMSDDGSRVFFQSPNGLTPGAHDQVQIASTGSGAPLYAQNVYEWEAQGTEVDGRVACEEASGCVSLISDGRDLAAEGSQLLGTDATGSNVFFTSSDQIVPADTDSGYDIYDARENGGFAESPAPTPCQGDACKGPGTGETAPGSPASGTFAGPEEGPRSAKASRCKKGFVKKGGRCVKKSGSGKHHKKASKKPHHKGRKKSGRAVKSDRRAVR